MSKMINLKNYLCVIWSYWIEVISFIDDILCNGSWSCTYVRICRLPFLFYSNRMGVPFLGKILENYKGFVNLKNWIYLLIPWIDRNSYANMNLLFKSIDTLKKCALFWRFCLFLFIYYIYDIFFKWI